ncbi:MAG TPA: tetratricopeptide repeat protein [Chroococcidiopsis sp.]
MTQLSLITAIQHYANALEVLRQGDRPHLPPLKQRALEVVLARDALQIALNQTEFVSASTRLGIEKQDQWLKDNKNEITKYIDLARWRPSNPPPQSAWWWYLEPPARFSWLEQRWAWLDRFDWLLTFLSLVALTFSFTVMLDTLKRVSGEGLDTTGLLPVIVQVLLTLAGGAAALTSKGRQWLETCMARWRIPKHFWAELSLVVALIVTLTVVGIHELYLPHLAIARQQQGIAAHERDQFDSALTAYRQAIALRPDFTEVHYYLGSLYEDLQQEEQAIAEYQLVVNSDFVLDPNQFTDQAYLERLLVQLRAYNNLGRLYLLEESERKAWLPLERGLSLVKADLAQTNPDVAREYYNLLKNMAWVRVQQERYLEAVTLANQAIEQDAQRAPGYCLKAAALDAQKQYDAALPIWESCVQYADGSNSDEDHWVGMAYAAFNRTEATP